MRGTEAYDTERSDISVPEMEESPGLVEMAGKKVKDARTWKGQMDGTKLVTSYCIDVDLPSWSMWHRLGCPWDQSTRLHKCVPYLCSSPADTQV